MMTNKKHSFVVLFFLVSWVSLAVLAYFNQNDKDLTFNQNLGDSQSSQVQAESFFKEIDYLILKNNKPYLKLNASEASINSESKKTLFFDPKGVIFSKSEERVEYQGMKGIYLENEGLLHLSRNVHVNLNQTYLESDEVKYYFNAGRVSSLGNVKTKSISLDNKDKILIDSDRATSWVKKNETHYYGNVEGRIIRKRVYEDQVLFKSNKLYLKMNSHLIHLEGDVFLKKKPFKAYSRRGDVYLENYNKKLKYFVLYDDVKLEEKVKLGENTYLRKAFAEHLEGIVSKDKIILTGYPRVYQQNDVIKGNRIILRENNEVVEVDDANTNFIIK